nr:calcium-dependent protein kinase 20-like [Ipomoea batatas]
MAHHPHKHSPPPPPPVVKEHHPPPPPVVKEHHPPPPAGDLDHLRSADLVYPRWLRVPNEEKDLIQHAQTRLFFFLHTFSGVAAAFIPLLAQMSLNLSSMDKLSNDVANIRLCQLDIYPFGIPEDISLSVAIYSLKDGHIDYTEFAFMMKDTNFSMKGTQKSISNALSSRKTESYDEFAFICSDPSSDML